MTFEMRKKLMASIENQQRLIEIMDELVYDDLKYRSPEMPPESSFLNLYNRTEPYIDVENLMLPDGTPDGLLLFDWSRTGNKTGS